MVVSRFRRPVKRPFPVFTPPPPTHTHTPRHSDTILCFWDIKCAIWACVLRLANVPWYVANLTIKVLSPVGCTLLCLTDALWHIICKLEGLRLDFFTFQVQNCCTVIKVILCYNILPAAVHKKCNMFNKIKQLSTMIVKTVIRSLWVKYYGLEKRQPLCQPLTWHKLSQCLRLTSMTVLEEFLLGHGQLRCLDWTKVHQLGLYRKHYFLYRRFLMTLEDSPALSRYSSWHSLLQANFTVFIQLHQCWTGFPSLPALHTGIFYVLWIFALRLFLPLLVLVNWDLAVRMTYLFPAFLRRLSSTDIGYPDPSPRCVFLFSATGDQLH